MKFQRTAFAVVALVLLSAGCEQAQRVDDITAPAYGHNQKPTNLVQRHGRTGSGRVCVGVSNAHGKKLLVGGHMLEIPTNAISGEAEFCMQVVAGPTIEVSLTATRSNGEKLHTFLMPLTLTLSYADARNVSSLNGLKIVHVVDGEVIETLDSARDHAHRTVSASLKHFSRYAMAAE